VKIELCFKEEKELLLLNGGSDLRWLTILVNLGSQLQRWTQDSAQIVG